MLSPRTPVIRNHGEMLMQERVCLRLGGRAIKIALVKGPAHQDEQRTLAVLIRSNLIINDLRTIF